MMTSKERVLTTLRFEKPDRVPFNLYLDENMNTDTPEKYRIFTTKYGSNFRVEHFNVDVIETFPNLKWPWRSGVSPLVTSLEDLHSLTLPDPNDNIIFSNSKEMLSRYPAKAVSFQVRGIGHIMDGILTYQKFFEYMLLFPEEIQKMVDKIGAIWEIIVARACELGITFIYLQDDLASNLGLTMSIEHIDQFILGPLIPAIRIAKEANIPVFFHSDGNTYKITQRLIDIGINAINPLEPRLNDYSLFKEKFHKKICVYGSLDNSNIIPHGTPEQVENHVLETFHTLGSEGGLIMSSASIPYTTPETNIEIMVKTIKEKCIY